MRRNKKLLFFLLTAFPFIYNGSCTNSCVLNEVTLSNYYKDTNQNIAIDPLGGYIFLYWIDANGNACHGEPGVSGQPGPLVIKAFSQEAYDAAAAGAVITQAQMEDYQTYLYANANYHASGFHFAQFDNVIWRNRADGKVFMDRNFHSFSKPVIVTVENTLCLNPIRASADLVCAEYRGILIPTLPSGGQHSSYGLVKMYPSNQNMIETELLNYCVTKIPHGLEITEN